MNIYIVNGFPGSGKDFFVEYAMKKIGKEYCINISTVDNVKKIAKKCGWNGEKTPKNRKFLSDLKKLLTEWNDYPFECIKKEIHLFKDMIESYGFDNDDNFCVFIMCRECEEIYKLQQYFNAKTILIQDLCKNEEEQEKIQSNSADEGVMNYQEKYGYTYTLQNSHDSQFFDVINKFLEIEEFEKI